MQPYEDDRDTDSGTDRNHPAGELPLERGRGQSSG